MHPFIYRSCFFRIYEIVFFVFMKLFLIDINFLNVIIESAGIPASQMPTERF
mgnify:CR=1 FL=1